MANNPVYPAIARGFLGGNTKILFACDFLATLVLVCYTLFEGPHLPRFIINRFG